MQTQALQKTLTIFLAITFLLLVGIATVAAREIPFSTEQTVDTSVDGARSVVTADIDGDGDMDVLGTSFDADTIAWWENSAGDGTTWTEHIVDAAFNTARSVVAADIDSDGDIDVIAAAQTDNDIAWWENTAGDGTAWTKRDVDTNFPAVVSVNSADVDGDGDMDILGAAASADDVAWWENTAGDGTAWTKRVVDANLDGAFDVNTGDMDGDGDLDVLAAARDAGDIAWWENTVGDGTTWTKHDVDTAVTSARSAIAADMDGDGDLDVLGTGYTNDDVAWWENTASDGTAWTKHDVNVTTVDDHFFRPLDAIATDMDSDGDMDIVAVAFTDDTVAWWENTDTVGTTWVKRTVNSTFDGAYSVTTSDLDSDGDFDIIASANADDTISWWANDTIHRSATYPSAGKIDIDDAFAGVRSVITADIDGDGDLDALGAAFTADSIAWWENTAGDGSAWTEWSVATGFDGARSVVAADIDGDGDVDVIGGAQLANAVAWWENTAGDGTAWSEQSIDTTFNAVLSVNVADVDGDGDIDILGASSANSTVSWWENSAGDGSAWSKHDINTTFDGAYDVNSADMDGDGDMDVLGAARDDDDVAWWENASGDGLTWTEHIVNTDPFNSARSAIAFDVDMDGDMDILGASFDDDDIVWWENTAGDGSAWTKQVVDDLFFGAIDVTAADLDEDGDLDILGAGFTNGVDVGVDIAWWENTAGDGSVWTRTNVDTTFDGAYSIATGDLDKDSDLDIVGAAFTDNAIAWWQNRGGQFAFATTDSAPATMTPNTMDDLLKIDAIHRGRSGDSNLELTTLELRFDGCLGESCTEQALTSAQANELFDALRIYLDDGSGVFETGSDTLVTTMTPLTLTGGIQTVTFVNDDPNVQVAQGTPQTYFVVVDRVDMIPVTASVDRFTITHVTETSSTAEDSPHDINLLLEYVGNQTSSQVVVPVNSAPIANDDFYTTEEDTPLVIAPNGVISNDIDNENHPLTVTVDSDVNNGVLDLNLDGSFVYTPTVGFSGDDSFTYILSDGGLTDTATVTLKVTVSDYPIFLPMIIKD